MKSLLVTRVTLSGGQEHDLQPAGTTLHVLSSVVLAPALGEAESHRVGVKGAVIGGGVAEGGVQSRQLEVEYLHGVGGGNLEDGEGS